MGPHRPGGRIVAVPRAAAPGDRATYRRRSAGGSGAIVRQVFLLQNLQFHR